MSTSHSRCVTVGSETSLPVTAERSPRKGSTTGKAPVSPARAASRAFHAAAAWSPMAFTCSSRRERDEVSIKTGAHRLPVLAHRRREGAGVMLHEGVDAGLVSQVIRELTARPARGAPGAEGAVEQALPVEDALLEPAHPGFVEAVATHALGSARADDVPSRVGDAPRALVEQGAAELVLLPALSGLAPTSDSHLDLVTLLAPLLGPGLVLGVLAEHEGQGALRGGQVGWLDDGLAVDGDDVVAHAQARAPEAAVPGDPRHVEVGCQGVEARVELEAAAQAVVEVFLLGAAWVHESVPALNPRPLRR